MSICFFLVLQTENAKQFASETSMVSNQDSRNTISTLSTPPSFRKLEITNEGYRSNDNIAESSFTSSVSAIEYRIKMEEDGEYLFDDGYENIVSFISSYFLHCC